MISRALAMSAAVAVLASPLTARAQAVPGVSQAETLFKAAKTLRDAGKVAEACTKFEQSKQAAPGVGVSLYLADCYERLGRTASAWSQFREAEKLASARKDKRAEVARAHAATLEPKLNRIVIVVAPAIPLDHAELQIDGMGAVSREEWKTGVAVDPGDHVVTLDVQGDATRTVAAHVDAATPSLTLTIQDPPRALIVPPPVAPPTTAPPDSTVDVAPPTRRLVGYGLLGAGMVGVGVGAALLVVRNQSMSNTGGPGGAPQVDQTATLGSTIAFAAGGAALVSAVILYLTTPAEKDSALLVVPAPITGGGGAFLRGSF
jgi:hypothetical protein